MMCDQCAALPSCPADRLGAYGRACWLAFGAGVDAPDCEWFVERYWRGGEWSRPRGSRWYGTDRG